MTLENDRLPRSAGSGWMPGDWMRRAEYTAARIANELYLYGGKRNV